MAQSLPAGRRVKFNEPKLNLKNDEEISMVYYYNGITTRFEPVSERRYAGRVYDISDFGDAEGVEYVEMHGCAFLFRSGKYDREPVVRGTYNFILTVERDGVMQWALGTDDGGGRHFHIVNAVCDFFGVDASLNGRGRDSVVYAAGEVEIAGRGMIKEFFNRSGHYAGAPTVAEREVRLRRMGGRIDRLNRRLTDLKAEATSRGNQARPRP